MPNKKFLRLFHQTWNSSMRDQIIWVSPPYLTKCSRKHRNIHHFCSQGTSGDSLWGCSSPTCIYSSNPWNFAYPMHPMAAIHFLFASHMIKQCHMHLWSYYKCKENSYQCEPSLHTLWSPSMLCICLSNPCVDEWNQVDSICAYYAVEKVMVHHSSHFEHLWEPPAPHVAPRRKITSPNFHPHLMWLK